jgi:hypothetical protein
MKFLCGNCRAKYQIADEKVEGRTLRMTCRECNKEIIIQGKQVARAAAARKRVQQATRQPAAGSVLAAELRRQVAAGPVERPDYRQFDEWHVAINDIPVGPMGRDEVARKVSLGAVTADSLAWREGLDDWMPARQIPELAVLFAPPPAASAASMPLPSPPDVTMRPAARASVAPIGGRLGAEAAPFTEDLLPPPPPPEPVEQTGSSALGISAAEPSPTRQMWQMAGPLFMMLSAGALIMMIGAVLGVKLLQAPSVVEKPAAAPAQQPAAPQEQPGASSGIVELDLQEIDGVAGEEEDEPRASGKSSRTRSTRKAPATTTDKGKKLSAEEKAMLARMGGGLGTGAELRARESNVGKKSTAGGGLKAEQLSRVVSRGKRQLQRCYESALRLNPTDETIRLDIEITVGASGSVTSVKTKGRSLGDMNRCIERTVRMWRFPGAGDVTRTSFPVVFQPGG